MYIDLSENMVATLKINGEFGTRRTQFRYWAHNFRDCAPGLCITLSVFEYFLYILVRTKVILRKIQIQLDKKRLYAIKMLVTLVKMMMETN